MPARALWTCPECRQRFVTARMWHSCVRLTTAEFFCNHDDRLKRLYQAYLKFVRRIGPVAVNVNKTRISFQGRVRFAGVAALRKDALVAGFWLKRRIHSPRFSRVEFLPPNDYVYQFRLAAASELDAEVEAGLREAYEVGAQRRDGLAPRPRRKRSAHLEGR